MDWQALLNTLGGTTVLVLAMAWLARKLIEQMFSKDMERMKVEMGAAAARELATLASKLETAAARERTRFDWFHQKQAEVVSTLYAQLAATHRAAKDYANPWEWPGEPSKDDKFTVLTNTGNLLIAHFDENRIFLPEEVGERVAAILKKIRIATQTMRDDLRAEQRGRSVARDSWSAAWKVVDAEVPPLLSDLRCQFREMLGGDGPTRTPDAK